MRLPPPICALICEHMCRARLCGSARARSCAAGSTPASTKPGPIEPPPLLQPCNAPPPASPAGLGSGRKPRMRDVARRRWALRGDDELLAAHEVVPRATPCPTCHALSLVVSSQPTRTCPPDPASPCLVEWSSRAERWVCRADIVVQRDLQAEGTAGGELRVTAHLAHSSRHQIITNLFAFDSTPQKSVGPKTAIVHGHRSSTLGPR